MSNNIKELRIKAGMTQRDLAEKSNVPYRTLQDWEDCRVKTSDVYKLHRIAVVLECSIEDLINFDDVN